MNIHLSKLSLILHMLAEEYSQRGIDTLPIENTDEYWTVEAPEWTDFKQEPALSVGSLRDDWAELEKLLEGKAPTAVDFDRLAAVLKVVAARLGVSPNDQDSDR